MIKRLTYVNIMQSPHQFFLTFICANVKQCACLSSFRLPSRDILPEHCSLRHATNTQGWPYLLLPHLQRSIQTKPHASTYPSSPWLNSALHSVLRLSLSLSLALTTSWLRRRAKLNSHPALYLRPPHLNPSCTSAYGRAPYQTVRGPAFPFYYCAQERAVRGTHLGLSCTQPRTSTTLHGGHDTKLYGVCHPDEEPSRHIWLGGDGGTSTRLDGGTITNCTGLPPWRRHQKTSRKPILFNNMGYKSLVTTIVCSSYWINI